MANNIKFCYQYRDGGNYKNCDDIVFDNPDNIGLAEIETLIRSKLIDSQWFYAKDLMVPSLITNTFDHETDPTWHEFISVENTCDLPNFSLSLCEWLQAADHIERG